MFPTTTKLIWRRPIIATLISVTTIVLTTLVIINPETACSCPRKACAPIISKCQLIDACRCEAGLNYTCYKECSHCLGHLHSECCSCVGVCPNYEEGEGLESHVKLLSSTSDDLFELLVSEDDMRERWNVHRDPVITSNSSSPMNCTMAFISECSSMYSCESTCISLGASGYRWFHVGCCECVGKYCLNFGVNEIRCRKCPVESDQVIDSSNEDL